VAPAPPVDPASPPPIQVGPSDGSNSVPGDLKVRETSFNGSSKPAN